MVKIGDKVVVMCRDTTQEEEVRGVAFLNDALQPSSALEGGKVMYLLDDYGWVPAEDCQTSDDSFFEQDDRSPHLLDLGYSMLGWSDGLEERPDNSKLPPIVTMLMAIQYDKEGSYGSSWKGKGEYRGIMSNIDRKYDRLDKMTDDEISGAIKSLGQLETELTNLKNNTGNTVGNDIGESKIDAIADLANYCLLYMTYVKEQYPHVFKVWVDKNIPMYLRDKIPFV